MKGKATVAEKSFDFALEIISLYKKLAVQHEYVLSKQLLRSGTSIGANIQEASAAISKRDFIAKMSIASKEARETLYWLRLLEKSKLIDLDYRKYIVQVSDLINMLTAIVKTSQEKLPEQ